MDTASRNTVHGISSNYGAQQPFVPTSFIQKMIAFFTQTTIIYVHPDVKVKQEGDIVHVLIKRGSNGQSNIEITLPSNGNLQYFSSTHDITELKLLFGRFSLEAENIENIQNRMFDINSDLDLENQSCLTNKANIKPQEETFNKNSVLHTANKSCSSSIDHFEENKTLYDPELPYELVSYSKRTFHLNGNTFLLESVKLLKKNLSKARETLILFRVKDMLHSPLNLVHLDIESIANTNPIDTLCISQTESEVRVEVLTSLSIYTAFQFARPRQFLSNCKRVRKLKDLIQCIKLGNQAEDDPEDLERVKTDNEEFFKACYSLNQDLYDKQSLTSKIKENEDNILENIKTLQQEMNTIQQDINSNVTKDKIVGESSYTNCFTNSKGTDRTKMGKSKLRTQPDRPTWNICLFNREEETEGVVREYFEDPIISQAIYEFFGQYIDPRYKGTFERPHVPWPSMHPLLPYKCRYLDNKES